MTASHQRALIRAAFVATVLTCTAPVFAQTTFDGPPFSAGPKALLAAAQKIDAKDLNIVYLLDEETVTFEPDGRAKSVYRAIEYVVTEDGVEGAGTASAAWAPWYDDKPVITARVITKDGTVHTLDPKAITESTAEEEQDMFSDQRVLRAPLPAVAAGAIVERVITFEGRSPIAGGGKYGLYLFGGNVPFERQRLVLDADASIAPRIVNKSGFEPVTTEQNGRKHIVFEKGHTDAFDNDEDYLPSDELNLPYVAFANGLMSEMVTDGSAAGIRELGAFDDAKRKDYGAVVARELMALRRYSEAADLFEAASKGTPQAGQTLALVQVLRSAKPYEKTFDDKTFKSLIAERLSKAHPDSGSAFSTWMSALVQTGRQAEALTIAKARLERLPKDEYAMREMARITASKGDYDAALTWARRTVDEVNPTTNDYKRGGLDGAFCRQGARPRHRRRPPRHRGRGPCQLLFFQH